MQKVVETMQKQPELVTLIYSETKEIKETANVAEAQELIHNKKWIVLSISGTQGKPIFALGRIA